jgi:hypothetical protein
MKQAWLLIATALMCSMAHAEQSGSVVGKSEYIYSHSKILNIVNKRNAETEALANALYEIYPMICGREDFKYEVTFRNARICGGVAIEAKVDFICP